MPNPSLYVPLREHWKSSNDVLLRELVKNGGELYSAVALVGGGLGNGMPDGLFLSLENSSVTDAGVEALASVTDIVMFHSGSRTTDAACESLAGMTRMRILWFTGMRMLGDGLQFLAGMTSLEQLMFFQCELSDEALAYLPLLPSLKRLHLNASRGLTDAGLECLARLPALLELTLNGTTAAGPGFRFLDRPRALRDLELGSSVVRITTDEDLSYLPTLPSVESLQLRYSLVTDRGLSYLSRLPALKYLSLEMTDVSDAGVPDILALSSLQTVNLDQTLVTSRGFQTMREQRPQLMISAQDSRGEAPQPEVLELIRRPEARAAAPVAESWARIEGWFAENFPAVLSTLRPPASCEDLDAFERLVGHELPQDFRESYLIHDGQDPYADEEDEEFDDFLEDHGILFGSFLPAIQGDEGLIDKYRRMGPEWNELDDTDDCTFYPPGAMRESYAGPGWLPFCGDYRDFVGIDLVPGPKGVYGQVIAFGLDPRFRPVLALSFAHFLEDIADEMEAGHFVVGVPGLSERLYWLRGVERGLFGNIYREWAEAKLPTEFQQV